MILYAWLAISTAAVVILLSAVVYLRRELREAQTLLHVARKHAEMMTLLRAKDRREERKKNYKKIDLDHLLNN